ncbi:MAG: hypothetical protein CVV23_01960 [Ignavibacteriae bacterium HGW-Ignavibacteriae-2]|jgi:preprotein translocase subunit SecE|nr:MAG: hypothetical protein CVV23_01960 [Ignavibacteriae bacterium HGW-Ignavibacteriae-2]
MTEDLQEQETPDLGHKPDEEEVEISHTDKLVGIFTEPGNTFSKMSHFPPKTSDWIIPILLVIVVAALSYVVLMSNPEIKYSVIEKQMTEMQKNLDEAVKSGGMTQEQADVQIERTREFMENQQSMQLIITVISIVVFTFIVFFIVSAVFWAVSKFGLKGDGNYSSAMVSYGLPSYISILQIIVMVIAGMLLNRYMTGTSVAAFMDMEANASIVGLLLSKVDPFSIWFYAIVSIGFAKMFKSKDTGKYFAMVFGLWIGFSIILYFIAQSFPFFKNFIR